MQTNILKLPVRDRPLAGTEDPDVLYFVVGDEGFALNRNILRPLVGSNLSVNKRMYKYRLRRAPWYVECTSGILSNQWRIFQRPLNVSPDLAVDTVMACAFKHNFVCEKGGYKFEDAMTVTGLEDVPDGQPVRGGLTANNVRNKVAEYFLTDAGAVPWQM
jgi:hypothetical protein